MKKIFIYYSLTGNGDTVAKEFENKGYEIRKVISKCKYPKSNFFKIMLGGYKATFNKKDKLVNFDSNIDEYDEVVIGSPIWNDRFSSPINTVLSKLDLSNKKVKFVLYSASGKANKASERIKDKYKGEIVILKEPKKNIEELQRI